MHAAIALLFSVGLLGGVVACGGEDTEVPNVVDSRLDQAKKKLDDAGFDDPAEDDALGDRTAVKESNWIVVGQDPAAGKSTSPDTKVTLRIAKLDDAGFLDVAQPDSSSAIKVRQQRAEAAAKRQADDAQKAADDERRAKETAAKQKQESKDYVNELDPSFRLGKGLIDKISSYVGTVEDGSVSESDLLLVPDSAVNGLTTYKMLLDSKSNPSHLEGQTDRLKQSVEGIVRAAETLASLNGSDDAGTLERFHDVFTENRTSYNRALLDIYNGTGVRPPLIR